MQYKGKIEKKKFFL